jgi:pSer/pThr/pTyr-binding forkhead associated (FHA) protein
VLDHHLVSRRHVYLQAIQGRLFWVDLDSRTGTRSDAGSSAAGWLDPGRAIRVGPYTVRLQTLTPITPANTAPGLMQASPLERLAPQDDPFPAVELEFWSGSSRLRSWRMSRVLALVGQSPRCKLQLVDDSVSQFHAGLVRTPAGLWVVDLASVGGTLVRDESVACSWLDDGDGLRVGKFSIRVHYDRRVAEPAADAQAWLEPESAPWLTPGSATGGADAALAPEAARARAQPIPPMSGLPAQVARSTVRALRPRVPQHSRAQLPAAAGARPSAQVLPAIPENLLQTFFEQFNQAQQQMWDRNQQAMLAMAEMFGNLYRDSTAMIREELLELRRVARELEAVQRELAAFGRQRPALPKPGAAAPDVAASPVPPLSDVRLVGAGAAPIPDAAMPPEPSGAAASAPAGFSGWTRPTSPDQASAPVPPPTAPGTRPSADVPHPGLETPEEVHAWLCQRMATLQREQESRWERILNTVRSKILGTPSVP